MHAAHATQQRVPVAAAGLDVPATRMKAQKSKLAAAAATSKGSAAVAAAHGNPKPA